MADDLRLSEKLDHDGEDASIRVPGWRDNAFPDFFLDHDDNKRWFRIEFEKFPQNRRGNVVGEIGDEFVRCSWACPSGAEGDGGIKKKCILRHNSHVSPVVEFFGQVASEDFIFFDGVHVCSCLRQRFGEDPQTRADFEDVFPFSQFCILNYPFHRSLIGKEMLPE